MIYSPNSFDRNALHATLHLRMMKIYLIYKYKIDAFTTQSWRFYCEYIIRYKSYLSSWSQCSSGVSEL